MKKHILAFILAVTVGFGPPLWAATTVIPTSAGSGSGDMTEAAYSTGGIIKNSKGGTGQNSSGSTGFPSVAAGTWSFLTVAQTRTALGLGTGNTAGLPGTCVVGDQYYDSQAAIQYVCTNATGPVWSVIYSVGSDGNYAVGALKNTGSYTCAADSTKGLWNWSNTGVPSSCYNGTNSTPVMSGALGANVLAAAGNALSAAGGLTKVLIALGQKALNQTAVTNQTCGTVQTVSATGVLTTDVINWGFSADPTGTTGYNPATGMLTIVAYPTADTINFKVCNNTAGSLTPGAAVTLNYQILR